MNQLSLFLLAFPALVISLDLVYQTVAFVVRTLCFRRRFRSIDPNLVIEQFVPEIIGPCFVVDGDTIIIGGLNIRLAGIDAPEMDHPYGKNAKWHLFRLTRGQDITAVLHGEQTYTREVATCYLPDGRDLSAEMVKAGLAIDWPKFSGGKYRHLEPPDARKRMWRADARQKGKWPPIA